MWCPSPGNALSCVPHNAFARMHEVHEHAKGIKDIASRMNTVTIQKDAQYTRTHTSECENTRSIRLRLKEHLKTSPTPSPAPQPCAPCTKVEEGEPGGAHPRSGHVKPPPHSGRPFWDHTLSPREGTAELSAPALTHASLSKCPPPPAPHRHSPRRSPGLGAPDPAGQCAQGSPGECLGGLLRGGRTQHLRLYRTSPPLCFSCPRGWRS